MDAQEFANSITKFAKEYLSGIVEARVIGSSIGNVRLMLPVVSYLIRLLSECGGEDELIEIDIELSDALVMSVHSESLRTAQTAAEIIKVARLAGFTAQRSENALVFKTQIVPSSIMQIYATSIEEFYNLLVTTYKM